MKEIKRKIGKLKMWEERQVQFMRKRVVTCGNKNWIYFYKNVKKSKNSSMTKINSQKKILIIRFPSTTKKPVLHFILWFAETQKKSSLTLYDNIFIIFRSFLFIIHFFLSFVHSHTLIGLVIMTRKIFFKLN